jgi:integrase
MNTQAALELQSAGTDTSSIDERRRAPWLLGPYTALSWTVSDTRDPNRTEIISFEYPLADGRMLHEADRLYATVKEYAWWVRDARYSRIDDAYVHRVMVRNMLHLAHALSIRKLQSFSQLQPFDIEELVEECRYGTDAVLRASDRISAYLERLAHENAASPKPAGGLPRYEEANGRLHDLVDREALAEFCYLPVSAAKLPRVSALVSLAAIANGLRVREPPPAELPPLQNQTSQSLQRWLDPLEQLYAMRRRIEAEAIRFRPFTFGAARVAAVKGVGTSRTPTAPPRLVLHLLEHSVRWLFDKAPAIHEGISGPRAVRDMATACWIIIAAFTARRVEEVNDLRDNCVRGDNESGWWLQVYIEKTLQRKEWIPVPRMVAQAVEMLRTISETARLNTQSDELFQYLSPDGECIRLDVARHLDNFAALVNVPLHKPRGGEPIVWHWHPHQFRRFFAVLYFYRYESGNLEALSHHLRHFSLEMTRRYVTEDPDVAALWTDTEWGYMGHVARDIVSGTRSIAGAAGERLKKAAARLIDMFRRNLQVTTPDRVGASLTFLMQRQGMVLTPKPWVTCACPRTKDAAAKAACRRAEPPDSAATGPNFAQAGPTVCASCPHAMTEGERQPFVDAEARHLEATAVSRPRAGTIFGELEAARVLEVRHVRDTRYAAAKPLQRDGIVEEDVV